MNNSIVLTKTSWLGDKAIETSVNPDMFVKGFFQRPNDENHTIVPISTIKHNITSQMNKAKAKGFLSQPVKTYNLSSVTV